MISERRPGGQRGAGRSFGDTMLAGGAESGVDALAMVGGALCLDFVNTAAGRGTPEPRST
jgi:hypothetical protein